MKSLRIVVCDDSSVALDCYASLCRQICKKHEIDMQLKKYTSGDELLIDMDNPKFRTTVNILLLDINMPGTDGTEVARQVRELGYRGVILFVTVSKELDHFKKAFDVQAINYFNKGEDNARFEELLIKAIKVVEDMESEVLTVSCAGRYKQIEIKNILYFDINQRIVTVHYLTQDDEQSFEFYMPLSELEHSLHGKGFLRVHRSFLVSLKKIESISFKNLTMMNGEMIPVGRTQYPALKEALAKLNTAP